MDYIKQFPEEIQVQVLRDMLVQEKIEEQKKMIQFSPRVIRSISFPSEELQLAAVTEQPDTIADIKNPTVSVQIAAVTAFPSGLHYIVNPCEEVKIAAYKAYLSQVYQGNEEVSFKEFIQEMLDNQEMTTNIMRYTAAILASGRSGYRTNDSEEEIESDSDYSYSDSEEENDSDYSDSEEENDSDS